MEFQNNNKKRAGIVLEKTFNVGEITSLLAEVVLELPISVFKEATNKAGLSESQVNGLLDYLDERAV